jgi:hypothetical protein
LNAQNLNLNLDTYGSFLYVLPAGLKNCQLVAGEAEVVGGWVGAAPATRCPPLVQHHLAVPNTSG